MTELLSPAGGREALVAAVQNGADAVYMGFGSFNARRSARNFSDEEFLAAVRYCHLRGVKVYLTLNTLVTDRELPALAETARRASEYGVDAILVQDWGVYETLRAVIPDVPLHASTQMALHTLSGVEEAARLGMTRAVLARELSGEEIREIAERAPIEIETFAHGALCMCYSGMCEMSAVIGGRSGNRPLPAVQLYDGPRQQPRRVRAALPLALWLAREGGRESTVAQGREPRGVCRRDGGDGRDLPEARGAHEAARVCGGGDGHLCRAAARAPRTDGGRAEKACAGILTRRVHGRLLPRPAREGNVWRSPGKCALAGGVVRHAAGGL